MRAILLAWLAVLLTGFGQVLPASAEESATIEIERAPISAVKVDTATLLRFRPNAWGEHYAWRQTNIVPIQPIGSAYTWNIPADKIAGTVTLAQPNPNTLQWDWALSAKQATQALPGAENVSTHSGLTFMLDLDSPARRGCKAVPQLLCFRAIASRLAPPPESVSTA